MFFKIPIFESFYDEKLSNFLNLSEPKTKYDFS